ncbi:MAG: hypothetical protein IKK57_04755 [Clostridia bacterium]|nr:hypothetical protein [Clostridia bacterium]
MLGARFSGMHRYTRSSRYVSRKKMKQQVRANRPGNQGFTFTGEYPEAESWQPVEIGRRSRSYMTPGDEIHMSAVVDGTLTERLPVVSSRGVRLGPAIAALLVLVALLAWIWMGAYTVNAGISARLSQQTVRMASLDNTAASLESEIALRCSGVNVRQEAARIGLKSSRGMTSQYVSVPEGAVINPANYGVRQDTASILGQ